MREGKVIPFTDTPILPTPQYLQESIARIEAVTSNGQSSGNEALARMRLDQILICALYELAKQSEQQPSKQTTVSAADKDSSHTPLASATNKDSPHKPPGASAANQEDQRSDQQSPKRATNTEGEDPALLELLHETPLSRIVTHRGRTKRLCGFADYSIWYDRSREGRATMATNLLIVEAKRQWYTDAALPQLASYMGIVHTARKEKSKQNCIVYGITSDGRSFRFCRIDNDGVFTRSPLLEWECDQDKIYTIIRSLLRAAALSSPSTTPIKDPTRRRIVLASFGSPQRAERFDYGVGPLNVHDLDDFDDAEVVHLDSDRQQ